MISYTTLKYSGWIPTTLSTVICKANYTIKAHYLGAKHLKPHLNSVLCYAPRNLVPCTYKNLHLPKHYSIQTG